MDRKTDLGAQKQRPAIQPRQPHQAESRKSLHQIIRAVALEKERTVREMEPGLILEAISQAQMSHHGITRSRGERAIHSVLVLRLAEPGSEAHREPGFLVIECLGIEGQEQKEQAAQ